jgi:hypothetical protein
MVVALLKGAKNVLREGRARAAHGFCPERLLNFPSFDRKLRKTFAL